MIFYLWNKFIIEFSFIFSLHLPRAKGAFPRLLSKFLIFYKNDIYLKTNQNAKLIIVKSSLDEYAYIYRNKGTINKNLLDLCNTYINNGEIFYDIGANVGSLTIDLAKSYQDNIFIYSFEPIKSLFEGINKSISVNKFRNVFSFNTLLGSNRGIKNFYISNMSSLSSIIPRSNKDKEIKISMETLDFLLTKKKIYPATLIKIDVEGGELQVLKGASKLIKQYRPGIIFEADINMKRFKYSFQDIINFFNLIGGYIFFGINNDVNQIELVAIKNDDPANFDNFLAIQMNQMSRINNLIKE